MEAGHLKSLAGSTSFFLIFFFYVFIVAADSRPEFISRISGNSSHLSLDKKQGINNF